MEELFMKLRLLGVMCANTFMLGIMLFISTPAAASLVKYHMEFFITPGDSASAGSGILTADITGDPSTSSLVSFVGEVQSVPFDSTTSGLGDFTVPSDYTTTALLTPYFGMNQSGTTSGPFLDVWRPGEGPEGSWWLVYTEGPVTLGQQYTLVEWVPIPPALWLFGSGLLGLIGIARRNKAA
jgi:hypothetical protein